MYIYWGPIYRALYWASTGRSLISRGPIYELHVCLGSNTQNAAVVSYDVVRCKTYLGVFWIPCTAASNHYLYFDRSQ